MSVRINHSACNHPSTKVARAACRRARSKGVPAIVSPIITAWESMKSGPLELTAGVETIAVEITRENWREFKGQRVSARVEDQFRSLVGEITGWSPLNFQIKTDEKTVRVPASTIQSVDLV